MNVFGLESVAYFNGAIIRFIFKNSRNNAEIDQVGRYETETSVLTLSNPSASNWRYARVPVASCVSV